MKTLKEGTFMTPVFRVSFPQVFVAKSVVAGAEPKFSLSMLFPKVFTGPDAAEEQKRLDLIKAAVNAAAVAKFGPDKTKWPTQRVPDGKGGLITVSALQSPWHDGTEKDYEGYDASVIYATASSKMKPGLVDLNMNPIIAPNEFYGGCYARATVTVYAYDNKKKGVGIGLRNIQKVRDGEPFSGASKPEDDFDAIPQPGAAPAGATAAPAGVPAGAAASPFGT